MDIRYVIFFLVISQLSLTDQVVVLGDDNLTSTLSASKYVMMEFYAPWCGHCKSLAPQYQKLPSLLKDLNVVIAKIDATAEEKSAETYEVQGFPTLKFYADGNVIDYKGERTAEAISKWIKGIIEAKVNYITQEQVNSKVGKQLLFVVAKTKDAKKIQTFKLAGAGASEINYYVVDSDQETITLYKDKETLLYTQELKADTFSQWVSKKIMPVLIPVGNQVYSTYLFSEHKGDILLFIRFSQVPANTLTAIQTFCKQNQAIGCGISDKEDQIFGGIKQYFKLNDDDTKNRIAYIFAGFEKAYVSDFDASKIGVNEIVEWRKSIDQGKVKAVVEQPSQVKYQKVVSLGDQNFNNYIKQNDYTFVQFYSPSCGHCMQFAPEYEAFAESSIKKQAKFKIAAVDCTKQTKTAADQNINGYPTLIFFFKGTPIPYKGQRKAQSIEQFINKIINSKLKVVGSIDEITRPSVVVYDSAGESSLNILAGLFTKYPVYQIKSSTSVKVEFQGDSVWAYAGALDSGSILTWVKQLTAPILLDFTSPEFQEYVDEAFSKNLPLLTLISNVQSSWKTQQSQLNKFCKDKIGKILCGFAKKSDSEIYKSLTEYLQVKDKQGNSLVYVDLESTKQYQYDQNVDEFTAQTITEFVQRINKGEIEASNTPQEPQQNPQGDNQSVKNEQATHQETKSEETQPQTKKSQQL